MTRKQLNKETLIEAILNELAEERKSDFIAIADMLTYRDLKDIYFSLDEENYNTYELGRL